jgi:hypothetical protein
MSEIKKRPDETEIDEEFDEEAQSLNDYISVFIWNSEHAKALDGTRTLLYRGQADKDYELTPSIFRNGLLPSEHTIIQKLLSVAADDFAEVKSHFERLVKMQHYGSPTRLLDITSNPLVALYFACAKCADKDGEVIVFYDYLHNHGELDVRVMSALAEYRGKSEQGMRTFLTENGFEAAKISTSDILSKPYLLVEPPMNNERIKRQRGAFAVVGIRKDKCGFEKECHNLRDLVILKENEGIGRSIIVPKANKEKLLSELDVIGINKAFLFPELEHQTAYLKSKYEVK